VRTPSTLLALAALFPLTACVADDGNGGFDEGAGDPLASDTSTEPPVTDTSTEPPVTEPSSPPPAIAAELTYFYVRPDTRTCDAPACGGYFVTPVNGAAVACPGGSASPECYVATLDTSALPLPVPTVLTLRDRLADQGAVIVGATVVPRSYPGVGVLGHLHLTEAWLAGSAADEPRGTAVKVNLNGIRCIVAPCPDKNELVLNTEQLDVIADLDFSPSAATDAEQAEAINALFAEGSPGLIVVGERTTVTGPTGATANARTVTQFYTRAVPAAATPTLTGDQCQSVGGKIRGDIGNGLAVCQPGELTLGRVTFGTEGGVCCLVD
jgi:hypothetical protein